MGLVSLPDGATVWSDVSGAGSPVVLCHGGPGLWDHLDGLARGLPFRLHRWDQRGCGRSGPAASYDMDVAVADLQHLKAVWDVRAPWGVVGHSWGAWLALITALRHPESTAGVVYVSGTGTPWWWREVGHAAYRRERDDRQPPERREHLASKVRTPAEEVEFRTLSWLTDLATPDASCPELVQMATAPFAVSGAVHASLSRVRPEDEELVRRRLPECEVPVLVLHGERDPRPAEGPRLLAEALPNATFRLIADAGHLPWVERPEEVAKAVTEFFQRVL